MRTALAGGSGARARLPHRRRARRGGLLRLWTCANDRIAGRWHASSPDCSASSAPRRSSRSSTARSRLALLRARRRLAVGARDDAVRAARRRAPVRARRRRLPEGARTVDQAGGSSAVARHAFGDLAGFVVGWAVLLDFIVSSRCRCCSSRTTRSRRSTSLDRARAPGRRARRGRPRRAHRRRSRLVRRPQLYRASIVVATVDIRVQRLLAVLGLAVVFDPRQAHPPARTSARRRPGTPWRSRSRSRWSPSPASRSSRNLLRETKKPGRP